MAKGKASSASKKNQYSRYESEIRFAKNRTRKLKRHMKKYPNDRVAEKALELAPMAKQPRRKTPYKSVWKSKEMQRYAQMLASVGLNGNLALERTKPRIDIRQREDKNATE